MLPASLFVQPSVGANALDLTEVASDPVLVAGKGLIGQTPAQLARMRGSSVVASVILEVRLDMARRHCADWVLDARDGLVARQTSTSCRNDRIGCGAGGCDLFLPAMDAFPSSR